MAASDAEVGGRASEVGSPPGKPLGISPALVGLVVAGVIVAAALFVGSQSGWESIGTGGINQSLLPKVGQVAPDFETEDVFGNPVRLSQFQGRPVWLMFWGSWCPPCRAEFPDIQAAYEQLEPQGLRMLGVSLRETPLDAASYAARNGATFLVLSDPDERDTGAAYPIYNFPTHIFIDADGVIRSIVLEDMDTEQALAEARRVLGDPELARATD
ncbi:MAG: alkyl hydroperoxide reductase/Thiol specific antioxidant/Mal allergen [Thermomicrobiales bacterium]|jgi:cytochrome c biogenesis protein CcmG/thiol:disulfide interchange protein DsbE|nr:alkyl hydroperoxide reductase/Thiol specific antioxidant/Mal allergen [Thermomicrobiales bacterium]